MRRVLQFLYILAICSIDADGRSNKGENCIDVLYRVFHAVTKAVEFFSQEYRNINLDALLGLRMAAGQLSTLLNSEQFQYGGKVSRTIFDTGIIEDIQRVQQEADSICQQAMPHVKRNYPQDYNHLGRLVTTNGIWDTNTEPRFINKRLLSKPDPYSKTEVLQEQTTDSCLAELLESSKYSHATKCTISNRCWNLMSAPGYSGYSLTHQILYFQIGHKMECKPTLKKRFDDRQSHGAEFSLESILDTLCASKFHEANIIASDGFPQDRQDLFLEQGLLCGILGYQDFYRQDWLNEILSWQDESGCFKNPYIKDEGRTNDIPQHRITKRREKLVTEDGCLSHKTSVALGFLSGYLRLLLQINDDQSDDCLKS